ncbi:MAG: tetratricopeptide repeat protein, partial [Proteobacteria bacterium]
MLKLTKSLLTGCFLASSLTTVLGAHEVQAAASKGNRRPASVRPDPDLIRKAQALQDQGKTDKAYDLLKSAIDAEKETPKRSLLHLAAAVIFERGSKDVEAEKELTAAIEDGGLRVADYAYYERGLLRKKSGKSKEARADFEQVIALKPSPSTETDARYELASLLIAD